MFSSFWHGKKPPKIIFLLHIIMHLYKVIAMFAHPKISLKQTSTGCKFLTRLKLSCTMMRGIIMNSCTCIITCDIFQNRGQKGQIWITIFSYCNLANLYYWRDLTFLICCINDIIPNLLRWKISPLFIGNPVERCWIPKDNLLTEMVLQFHKVSVSSSLKKK